MLRIGKHANTRWLWRCLQFFFFACCLPLEYGAGTRAVLTVADFAPVAYACEISGYGNRLEQNLVYRSNLMKLPGDPQLCEFPTNIVEVESNSTFPPIEYPNDLALLVSLGSCDVYQKAEIAVQLYNKISDSIKYIVFYNNDPDNSDKIVSIPPPNEDSGITVPENIRRLALLSVSTSAGANMMSRIAKLSTSNGQNPVFLGEGSGDWELPMLLERVPTEDWDPPTSDPYVDNDTRVNTGNFYWFRFILFALLIMSPCCRGAYLWYHGGGRIHFRRNEDGRIIGLQYVPPISYWFASNGGQDSNVPVSDRLTEEQVMDLPEITFKGTGEVDTKLTETEDETNDQPPQLDDVDIVVSSGSADENDDTDKLALDRTASVSESVRLDEEEVPEGSFATNCTTCSICIEEFEPGERLRYLPRCKHAFHTECILPWLTERQGCCPLCKTSVREEGGEGENVHELATTEAEPTISQEDTGTEQGSLEPAAPSSSDEPSESHCPEQNPEAIVQSSSSDPAASGSGSGRDEGETRHNDTELTQQ